MYNATPTRISWPPGVTHAPGRSRTTFAPLRRLGERLYAAEDARARSHGWQITETWGGLGRIYRDRRFAALGSCITCAGTGRTGHTRTPCTRCNGEGRTWLTTPTRSRS